MHLRSGKVTVAPPLPWPRPTDVITTRHESLETMSRAIEDMFSQRNLSLTQRRTLFLRVCETMLANAHLANRFSELVNLAIRRLDDEGPSITTFNARAYSDRLRSLEVF